MRAGRQGKERRTIEIEVIHSSYIRLGLPADETNTLVFAAITRLRFVAAVLSVHDRTSRVR